MVATRRFMPYAAVLAAVLALGACSGGDPTPPSWASTANGGSSTVSSSGSATSSAAPSSSAAPTPAEDPVLARIPKAARAETPAGAEAFVKFYFAQLNSAFRKADPDAVRGLTTDECTMCGSMAAGVKDAKSKNLHYDGDLISVETASSVKADSKGSRVLVVVKQNAVKILDSTESVTETTPAGWGNYVLTLKHSTHWRIVRVQEAK